MSKEKEKELIQEQIQYILQNNIQNECSLVAILWKKPELYLEYYNLAKEIIKSKIWKFYLEIGNRMYSKGYNIFDELSVNTFIDNLQKEAIEEFNKNGGYDTISTPMEVIDTNNIMPIIEDLKKSAIVYNFITKLSLNQDRIDKLLELDNAERISDFLDIKLDEISLNISKSDDNTKKVNNLLDNIEIMIEEADSGMNIGLPILNSPILNYELSGLCLGCIYLVGGQSGVGKSTLTQELYLCSLLEQGEAGVFFLNEQDLKKWQQQALTSIINNIVLKEKNDRFNAKRWRQGKFTEQEKIWIYEAKSILEQKMKDNLIIIEELNYYSIKEIKKAIKKYAKRGIKYFCVDTFKLGSDYDGKSQPYLALQQDMRELDDLVKPSNLNVCLWVTLQLDKSSMIKRYLSRMDIGMSKNVVDVATVVLLIRNLHNDEYEGQKNKIKVINPIKTNDEYLYKSGSDVIIENGHHNIIFIDKNRNGESGSYQIVCKQNLGTLEYKEVGVTDIPFGT